MVVLPGLAVGMCLHIITHYHTLLFPLQVKMAIPKLALQVQIIE